MADMAVLPRPLVFACGGDTPPLSVRCNSPGLPEVLPGALLPESPVCFDRPQLRLGVGEQRTPAGMSAELQGRAGGGAYSTKSSHRPEAAQFPICPGLKFRACELRMLPGGLFRGLWLRQVQDATQALETLLHVLVVGGPGMQPAGII